jgi:hypothetical protein
VPSTFDDGVDDCRAVPISRRLHPPVSLVARERRFRTSCGANRGRWWRSFGGRRHDPLRLANFATPAAGTQNRIHRFVPLRVRFRLVGRELTADLASSRSEILRVPWTTFWASFFGNVPSS